MLTVLSTLAMKGVLEDAAPPGAAIRYHSTQALLEAITAGERADVVILTREGIDKLGGKVSGRMELGSSGVGLAVRAGAPKPDISTVAKLEQALLGAASVAHSKSGASGLYFSGLLERRGWASRLKKRVVVERGPAAAAVVAGDAEIAVQLLCELAPVKGIDVVGAFPAEVDNLSHFSAAVMKPSTEAEAFMQFLQSPQVRAAMQKNLFTPARNSPRRPG
jgi:molybdate transport system substrate-binding protein